LSTREVLTAAFALAGVVLITSLGLARAQTAQPGWLADRHVEAGLACASCHGTAAPADVANGQCLTCHGSYEALAKKTTHRSRNPHDSHYPNLDCITCHHGHQTRENFCASCHGQE
jgi:DnaJ-class molecular chaperone